ncbi:FkbM family methyltransferase [Prosthecobacter fusiformis]|uniref:FkbM family methyltransferase n=1 Tax=Prosthecobacter fusiformis TaxID=48464 RepID=A0A4R7S151_9BACT|nr:FkbM family methyltransferase [Prosthecobacter fusiformis]TDU71409.1 FkbM family methyltransferase [Prosthecobacter fusiformis]
MNIRTLFHQTVRIPLKKFGIHVCASHKYPVCSGSLLDLAVAAFLPTIDDFVVCQVGASDGKSSDPLEHLIDKYELKGILIEPLPGSFELLAKKYHRYERITCVNCAISDIEGLVTFYCPKNNGRTGISEFQKSGMTKVSLVKAGIPESDIEEISVNSKTLPQVMQDQGLAKIDLLQIDTEGYDYEIVKQGLKLPAPPAIIHFETIHLSRFDKLNSRHVLTAKGYSLIESETDTLAYQFNLLT